jgi:hypothetical protein
MGKSENLKYSLIISLFPSVLITFMLDYGSTDKTFITEEAGREVVVTGLDGIALYIKEHGLLDYLVSVIPTFVGIFALLTLLVVLQVMQREKRESHDVEQ